MVSLSLVPDDDGVAVAAVTLNPIPAIADTPASDSPVHQVDLTRSQPGDSQSADIETPRLTPVVEISALVLQTAYQQRLVRDDSFQAMILRFWFF